MSTPFIASESPTRVIELSSEEQTPSDSRDVTRFQVISGIQEEIHEFIKKKLFDSIELQQFLVNKDIEFNEKYVDFLTSQDDRGHYNNHNDLEEQPRIEISSERRAQELEIRRNVLNELRTKLRSLLEKEQEALDYLNSPIKQFNILHSVETARYKIKNKDWMCSFNNSITLQKIKLICEKLKDIGEMEMELKFWSTEALNLFEKLQESDKEVALGIIIEMISWTSENENLIHLANCFIEKEETRDKVFKNLENVNENITLENYVTNIKVFVTLFLKLTITDVIYRQKIGNRICQLMTKALENLELRENHLISIVEIFETYGQRLLVLTQFDQILGLIESKSEILSRSQQSRVTSLLTIQRSHSPIPVPLLAPRLTSSRVSVRNLTVIEYPSHAEMHEHKVVTKKEMEELEKEMERKIRMKLEEEMRMKEQKRIEEEMKKKEKERLDEQKIVEERKKKEEEEERKRKEQERIRLEEENKKKEEERKKREREEQARLRLEEQREEERRAAERERRNHQSFQESLRQNVIEREEENPCTIFPNVRFWRHTRPNEYYDQSVFDGKIIGFYFSAHWCPPSRDFTPILLNFYSQVEEDFEVCFISNDRNQQEMQMYMQQYHGDWFHLPLNSAIANDISNKCGGNSIPTLAIYKPNGIPVVANAREAVQYCNDPQALINLWKS